MNHRILRVAHTAGALALVSLAARAQGIRYTITDVTGGQPISAIGQAALSSNGYVVGYGTVDGANVSAGYRWSPHNFVLPQPPPNVVWASFDARGVAEDGTFVGIFGTSGSFMSRGYRASGGTTVELLTPSGGNAFPNAINNSGWIVGMSSALLPNQDGGVVWDPSANPSTIVGIDDAIDINDAGQIVGAKIDLAHNNNYIAYFVDHGTVTPIGTLDPQNKGTVNPMGMNELGVVVGRSVVGLHDHAFVWSLPTGIHELPGLGINHFPNNVGAMDINDQGWAVGYAPNTSGQTNVIWAPDGSVKELDLLVQDYGPNQTFQLLNALRINDAGQIAGTAFCPTQNLNNRTVLLTPANLTASALVPSVAGAVNTLTIANAAPNRMVLLAVGAEDPFDRGYTPIPGCEPLGLAIANPRVVAAAVADSTGAATLHWSVPSSLAGKLVRLQGFQRASCSVSPVVHVTF